jgi:hypothetical protein
MGQMGLSIEKDNSMADSIEIPLEVYEEVKENVDSSLISNSKRLSNLSIADEPTIPKSRVSHFAG